MMVLCASTRGDKNKKKNEQNGVSCSALLAFKHGGWQGRCMLRRAHSSLAFTTHKL
jgi:hypothetical protein